MPPNLDEIWNRYPSDKSRHDQKVAPCLTSINFRKKMEGAIFDYFERSGDQFTENQIARAKYVLQEEWHRFRRTIPEDHRRELSYRKHDCVDEVYHELYQRLDHLHVLVYPSVDPFPKAEAPKTQSRAAETAPVEGEIFLGVDEEAGSGSPPAR